MPTSCPVLGDHSGRNHGMIVAYDDAMAYAKLASVVIAHNILTQPSAKEKALDSLGGASTAVQ